VSPATNRAARSGQARAGVEARERASVGREQRALHSDFRAGLRWRWGRFKPSGDPGRCVPHLERVARCEPLSHQGFNGRHWLTVNVSSLP
jgi:hypothetical protein